MAWAKSEADPTLALLPGRLSFWVSRYPDSQERWVKDLAPFYELVGEYNLENAVVLRFDMNELRKSELPENNPSVIVVEIPRAGKSKA